MNKRNHTKQNETEHILCRAIESPRSQTEKFVFEVFRDLWLRLHKTSLLFNCLYILLFTTA